MDRIPMAEGVADPARPDGPRGMTALERQRTMARRALLLTGAAGAVDAEQGDDGR